MKIKMYMELFLLFYIININKVLQTGEESHPHGLLTSHQQAEHPYQTVSENFLLERALLIPPTFSII